MAASIDPDIRHVACIGVMGAVQAPVGEHVAAALGWPFVDVEDEVEARTGRTVAELAYDGGEALFRPWERLVVLEALDADEPSVVAAPGGIALDPEARKALGAVDVAAVYLRADPGALATVMTAETEHEPPRAGEDPLATLVGMFSDRDATYRAMADVEVPVDGRSAEEVARLVLEALSA